MLRHRLSLLAPTLALLAALLVAGPALSALRIGTNGSDILTGTKGSDQLTGKKGEDVLKGLAGNDVYFFADNFSTRADGAVGVDTLVELKAAGSDTVNFRNVKAGGIEIYLVREWGSSYNFADGPSGNRVVFNYTNQGTVVQSFVEKAIGGQGNGDFIFGGGSPNTIMPGSGAIDFLYDYGGYNDGAGVGQPELAASNDVFKGFADNTGPDYLWDYGGTGDILDLRPFSIDDVFIDSINMDDTPASEESLQIVTGLSSQVVVQGQFG